ncbi:predicted protein [Streptomyces viridochromogenes DSM 40736]|uniref:Predicted protein n=1 Tax=Streptomyces viridochromogenes (strain DSM 40736 / JCM 4977 / BCRC 1201 / Tue 494) TaxID=591159 RepID=D9XI08_STRVT|nr:predicted protein [Streptomyces viridochromogenes DSM 40736]
MRAVSVVRALSAFWSKIDGWRLCSWDVLPGRRGWLSRGEESTRPAMVRAGQYVNAVVLAAPVGPVASADSEPDP